MYRCILCAFYLQTFIYLFFSMHSIFTIYRSTHRVPSLNQIKPGMHRCGTACTRNTCNPLIDAARTEENWVTNLKISKSKKKYDKKSCMIHFFVGVQFHTAVSYRVRPREVSSDNTGLTPRFSIHCFQYFNFSRFL